MPCFFPASQLQSRDVIYPLLHAIMNHLTSSLTSCIFIIFQRKLRNFKIDELETKSWDCFKHPNTQISANRIFGTISSKRRSYFLNRKQAPKTQILSPKKNEKIPLQIWKFAKIPNFHRLQI